MRVAIVVLQPLASDSRVLRAASALHDDGHEVLLVGHGPAPADAPYRVATLPDRPSPWAIRAGIVLRQAPANLGPRSAHWLYWSDGIPHAAWEHVKAFRPDVVHANDWNTLPIAVRAKAELSSKIVYDAHEMATAEFEDSLLWRWVALAHVSALEGSGITHADAVVTVSPGIGRMLRKAYPTIPDPVIVRNIPSSKSVPPRTTDKKMTALFHGNLRPGRGLEALIDSVVMWRPGVDLIFRGNGMPAYIAALKARAESLGIGSRVHFLPAVPSSMVVVAASEADIGFVFLNDSSRNNRHALPNKLFEYIAAGIAIFASPLPDISEIVRSYGCGILVEPRSREIAAAVNRLTPPMVDDLRRASCMAAEVLNWEHERLKLTRICREFAAGSR